MRGSTQIAIVIALVAAGCLPGAVTPVSTPRPTQAQATPTATVQPQPIATPSPTRRAGVAAEQAGPIPPSFRYLATRFGGTLLWLIDLERRGEPRLVARWDGTGSDHSVSRDGRVVLIAAPGPHGHRALYLLRPETGQTSVLFEAPDAGVAWEPQLTADGTRFAFTKHPAAATTSERDLGIWSGLTGGGPIARMADPSSGTSVPARTLGWSTDGRWLAFTRELEIPSVFIVPAEGGPPILVGEGHLASWRALEPKLLVATGSAARAPGPASLYAFDVAARASWELHRSARPITFVAYSPSGDRFLHVERGPAADPLAASEFWMRDADGSAPRRLAAPRGASDAAWSPDGAMITVQVGGDDSTVPVTDILGGRFVGAVCRRGGTPPPAGRCV